MRHQTRVLTAIAATAALAGVAYAADQAATTPTQETAAQSAVDKDVTKLSTDGAAAFRDMHMARLAIFNANPSEAKTLIAKAQTEFEKAKTDNTTFTKAEAELKQPAAASKTATATATAPATDADMKKPVAWLPVDGQLVLADDFVATPDKAKAVSDANKSLEKGDQKGALDKLKLADVNVSFTMAVLPLAATTTDVDKAATLINDGKYYEANTVLKQAEDGLRFDMVDLNGVPKGMAGQKMGAAMTAAPAAKTQ